MSPRTREKIFQCGLVLVGLGIAIAVRLTLLHFRSGDFFAYTKGWYNTIEESGFAAFGTSFSNYNLPYLYVLYGVIRLFPDLPSVIAIKLPSLIADFVSAWFVYKIVGLKYRSKLLPLVAGWTTLLAPTMILNSALWGQADAVYASILLACIYSMARGRDHLAMALFGLGVSFKAQAAFLFPVIIALALRRALRWHSLFWIPAVYLALLLPAVLAGRPITDLLLIYPLQMGQYEQLSMHAPSALAWIPDTGRFYRYFYYVALILAGTAALTVLWAISRSSLKVTPGALVEWMLVAAVLLPFLLPKMHERYFYLADIFSILFAFFTPVFFFVPLTMITISFFAYQPALFGSEPVPMSMLAFGVCALVVVILHHSLSRLYPSNADG